MIDSCDCPIPAHFPVTALQINWLQNTAAVYAPITFEKIVFVFIKDRTRRKEIISITKSVLDKRDNCLTF